MLEREEQIDERVTIEAVSRGTGVSRHTLSRMINQPKYSTSTEVIDKLCSYFRCEIGDLIVHIKE